MEKKEELFKGKFLNVVKVDGWEYVSRTGTDSAVVIIAYDRKQLILVQQNRIPIGQEVLEFPAGILDEGYTVEQTAIKELREETGYLATLEDVVYVFGPTCTSPGLTSEKIYYVKVRIHRGQGEQELEPKENIRIVLATPEEVIRIGNRGDVLIGSKLAGYINGTAREEE